MTKRKSIVRWSLLPTKNQKGMPAPANKNNKSRAFTVSIEDDELVLRLPLTPEDQRKISKSGKSIICAGTGGTKIARCYDENDNATPIEINGKALRVCATAWISADNVSVDAGVDPAEDNSEKE